MRVLVTRPAREAADTARRLRERGHEAVLAPVLDVAATGAALPAGPFDALLATSAQAFEALSEADAARIADLPAYVVGTRTAEAARGRDLTHIAQTGRNVLALAASLREAGSSLRNVLYIAGRDRKPDLETVCGELGLSLQVAVVYEARAATVLPEAAARALSDGSLDAVLHFSRRSADILLKLAAAAQLTPALARPRHVCLSADVAEPLVASGFEVVIAERPDILPLFDALEKR